MFEDQMGSGPKELRPGKDYSFLEQDESKIYLV